MENAAPWRAGEMGELSALDRPQATVAPLTFRNVALSSTERAGLIAFPRGELGQIEDTPRLFVNLVGEGNGFDRFCSDALEAKSQCRAHQRRAVATEFTEGTPSN
jgi:hypothetical protein